MRRQPHKDLKLTKLCLGPIQTGFEAFLGFLGKTKMKAYTKLTVVVCCQIVARKSVAPPSAGGDRCRGTPVDKIRSFEDFFLVKYYLNRFRGRSRSSASV